MNNNIINLFNTFDNIFLGDFISPKNYNRKNVLKKGDTNYQGFCLGLVFSWNGGRGWRQSRLSKVEKFKPLLENGLKLMKEYDPDFVCTSIQFNKNYKIAKHIDGNNVGESYIIGFGSYTGGELIVYDENDKPTYVDINHKFYKFNGSRFYHESADFLGDRITLVFFKLGPQPKPK